MLQLLPGRVKTLGRVVQLLHLKAGTYLLAVDAPADGNAIAIQPALVGIATPDGSPPDEVKRQRREKYLAIGRSL